MLIANGLNREIPFKGSSFETLSGSRQLLIVLETLVDPDTMIVDSTMPIWLRQLLFALGGESIKSKCFAASYQDVLIIYIYDSSQTHIYTQGKSAKRRSPRKIFCNKTLTRLYSMFNIHVFQSSEICSDRH